MAEDIDVTIPNEGDGVEIVIDRAKPAPDVPVVIAKPDLVIAPEPKIITADEGVEDLKAQVERAKSESANRLGEFNRRIQEAAEQARRAEERARNAELEATTVKKSAVETVLDNLKRDKADAKRELQTAYEAADWGKVAEATDRLSEANARIQEAEKGRLELEDRVRNPSAPQSPQPVQRLAENDPVEQFVATLSVPAANWVRSHPDYVRDARLNRKMIRAHEDALEDGHAVDSPGYFNSINERLGLKPKEPVREAPRETTRAPVSAPVSRDTTVSSNGTTQNSASTVVRLTASEARTALETYSSLFPKESNEQLYRRYAMDQAALKKEGKIGRVAS